MIQCDSQFQQYRLVGKLFRVLNFTLNRLNRSKIVLNFSIARFCLRPGCTYNWVGSYMTKFWKILKNAVLKKKTAKREGNSLSKHSNVIQYPHKIWKYFRKKPYFCFLLSLPLPTHYSATCASYILCLLLLKILLVGSIGYPARFWYFFILVVSPLCYCLYTNLGFVQFWWWMGHTKKETSNTLLVISWAIWLHSANT